MVKLIGSVSDFDNYTKCLRWQLLKFKYNLVTVELSKIYYLNKKVFIGNKWKGSGIYEGTGLYIGSKYWCWQPLGFERSILYK